jgi:predicted Zn-dependent protease
MSAFVRIIPLVLTAVLFFGTVMVPGAFAISLSKERELAEAFMKVVRRQYDIIDDPFLTGYLNEVGQRLVHKLPPQPFAYRFYLIRANVYNAFAGPGGHIFINSGLIQAMENEDQLAGILAHEIAHVKNRHISQRIERSSKISMASLAGMVAGIFLGGGGSEIGSALSVGSMAAGQSAHLAYSRKDEMEADQLGLKYLSEAGYDGAGLLAILKKIRAKQWYGSDQVPSYLMTHPAVEARLVYVDGWLATHPKAGARSRRPERFLRARIRLAALYGDLELTRNRFAALAGDHPEDSLVRYGYALVRARSGDHAGAIKEYAAVVKEDASAHWAMTGIGRSLFLTGQYDQARVYLERALSGAGEDADALFFLGRTHMALGDYDRAMDALSTVMMQQPRYPQVAQFLGEAYGKQGRLGSAHYYLGIHYKGLGRYRNARFHFNRALKHLTEGGKIRSARKMLEEMKEEEPVSRSGGRGRKS